MGVHRNSLHFLLNLAEKLQLLSQTKLANVLKNHVPRHKSLEQESVSKSNTNKKPWLVVTYPWHGSHRLRKFSAALKLLFLFFLLQK